VAKDESTEEENTEDESPTIDAAAIIKSAVEDAMDGWWKKNRPAPNRTARPEQSLFNTLFGSYK